MLNVLFLILTSLVNCFLTPPSLSFRFLSLPTQTRKQKIRYWVSQKKELKSNGWN